MASPNAQLSKLVGVKSPIQRQTAQRSGSSRMTLSRRCVPLRAYVRRVRQTHPSASLPLRSERHPSAFTIGPVLCNLPRACRCVAQGCTNSGSELRRRAFVLSWRRIDCGVIGAEWSTSTFGGRPPRSCHMREGAASAAVMREDSASRGVRCRRIISVRGRALEQASSDWGENCLCVFPPALADLPISLLNLPVHFAFDLAAAACGAGCRAVSARTDMTGLGM